MKRSVRHSLRRLAPVTALAVAAAGLSAAGLAAAGNASADEAAAPIKLIAPSATKSVERYEGEPVYLYRLGIYAVAEKAALEIRTRRTSYRAPIVSTLSLGSGSTKVTRDLPAGLITKVDHLEKFFTATVTDKTGAVVKTGDLSFCPNNWSAARSAPDGAPTSPYPYQCGDHPFALGNVFGIQRGWSVPALGDFREPFSFDGQDGEYTVNLTIQEAWRTALGLPEASSKASARLSVKTVAEGEGKPGVRPGTANKQVASGHQHGTTTMAGMTGDTLSPQHAEMEADRRQSLGKAATPAAKPPVTTLSKRSAAATTGPKPDLRSLPAYQIELDQTDGEGNPTDNTYLNFGATVWNAGPSPLVVDAFRRPDGDLMDAYQYFYDSKGQEVGSAPAGTMEWDPREGHTHWHFTDFATYRLLDSTKQITERSGKEAFCLVPTDLVDLNVKNATWRPSSTDLTTACGEEDALSIREVLDTGWGDTYGQYLPGQSFDVTSLKNGIYFIEVLANPELKLSESNTGNNQSLRKVELGGTVGGKRTLKVYPYEGIAAP